MSTPIIDKEIVDDVPVENRHEEVEDDHTWIEEIEMAGSQLVERVKELVAEGNVRRLIIRAADDKVLLEVPLTAGVAVGGVVTIIAPILAALGALAALLAKVKVQVVRKKDDLKE